MTLYKIADNLADFISAYENGDIPDDAYADTLNSIQIEVANKTEQLAKIIRNLEGNNLALKSESDRLSALQKTNTTQILHIKKYLYEQMKKADMPKFATTLFKFSICKNGGLLPLKITGEEIPLEYRKNEADTTKIREAIADGIEITFAQIGERGEHLRIK